MPLRVNLEERPTCPMLVYLIWPSGRHAAIWVPCHRWRCLQCAKRRLDDIAMHVADMTVNKTHLHQLDALETQAEAVRRSIQRKKLSSLRIRHHDGSLYVLTDGEVSGRGWSSTEKTRIEALMDIKRLDTDEIQRRDFTNFWKPEAELTSEENEKVICRLHVSSYTNLRQLLKNVGEELDSDSLRDPYKTANRLANMSGLTEGV
jgi:hypothetical protein